MIRVRCVCEGIAGVACLGKEGLRACVEKGSGQGLEMKLERRRGCVWFPN